MSENVRTEFDNAVARFQQIVSPNADELLIVLKGHLLVEEKLRAIISSSVANPEYIENARLSFANVLQLARAFVGHLNDSSCWTAAEKLNSTRNKLAHQAEPLPSAQLLSQFFDVCESEPRWAAAHGLPRCKAKLHMYLSFLWVTFDALHTVVTVCVKHAPNPLTSRSKGPQQEAAPEP